MELMQKATVSNWRNRALPGPFTVGTRGSSWRFDASMFGSKTEISETARWHGPALHADGDKEEGDDIDKQSLLGRHSISDVVPYVNPIFNGIEMKSTTRGDDASNELVEYWGLREGVHETISADVEVCIGDEC